MVATRAQTGQTPRKPANPDFVETPSRRRTVRKSLAPKTPVKEEDEHEEEHDSKDNHDEEEHALESPTKRGRGRPRKSISEHANGDAKKLSKSKSRVVEVEDARYDKSGHFEFGGQLGVTAMMIGFPLLMYYMWIGATFFDGHFPVPRNGQSFTEFIKFMAFHVYTHAYPSARAFAIYWTFFVAEAAGYVLLPGVWAKGQPLPHLGGRQLDYYCSALSAWYATIVVMLTLHFTGLFKLYTLIDEFGPIMSVAIITGFLASFITYVSAIVRGATHRMSGYPLYDFFMGAELNPRMFNGVLDFKMFYEVRIPWFMLFLLSCGAAARQYEEYGYVSGEVAFLVMAHWLYANACSKGEECIVTTWDMYYEKLGFMLTFWNLAGVPLSYCHCTLYLANHDPKTYAWNKYALSALFVVYLFVYWIWDTTNSQKNRFRSSESGAIVQRNAFPQLPWQTVTNPRTIKTKAGHDILADGWYGYARKIHYTCDLFFALSWGAITGFNSPFPWFYPLFFTAMISHRAARDIARCRERYGEAWTEYEKLVPYLFIPELHGVDEVFERRVEERGVQGSVGLS